VSFSASLNRRFGIPLSIWGKSIFMHCMSDVFDGQSIFSVSKKVISLRWCMTILGEGKFAVCWLNLTAQFESSVCNSAFFRFANGQEGFFDDKGNSLKKAFLKAPLNFSRISSKFSNSRLHPVLKIRRPHHGVDYAAPTGTPVYSIGDGVVVKKTYQAGGGGNYLSIKHNSVYTSHI
jgi:hypothetical protein